MTAVPDGTVQDVLDWVGDDPVRAQEALDAETKGDQRTTLITRLEAIASADEEDDMTETATAESTTGWEDAPEAPSEVEIDPGEDAVSVGPVHVRDAEVEFEDVLAPREGEETLPAGNQVETLQAAGASHGLLLAINGEVYAFNAQMVAVLKQIVDKTIAGLTL